MSQEAAGNRNWRVRVWLGEAQEDEPCPICLGPMTDTARIIPCGHSFCGGCIQQWMASRNSCPLCRRSISFLLNYARRARRNASTRRVRGRVPLPRQRQERSSTHRSRSTSPRHARRSPSRPPQQLIRSMSWQGELNGHRRLRPRRGTEDAEAEQWLRRVQREQLGTGDHTRHHNRPGF